MALRGLKQKALELRLKGFSYSQIKSELNLSKGTLSGWLSNYPLSPERILELQARSPRRIESYRNTMRLKREAKLNQAYTKVAKILRIFSKRELLVGGFFLYWAEGGKTKINSIALTNTNPAMLKVFLKWLDLFKIPRDRLKIKLHLYTDMDVNERINFWSKELGIGIKQFTKPYIKKSKLSDITYKNGFGHGTCTISLDNTEMARHVLMGIKHIENMYK